MTRFDVRAIAAAIGALWFQSAVSGDQSISGTARFPAGTEPLADAVFEAELLDVSKADVAAEMLSKVRIDSPGQPPIAFEIPYDPSDIDDRHQYSVRAVVRDGGRLLFTTERVNPVLTRGAGNTVSVVMREVDRSQTPATEYAPLEATRWNLTWAGGQSLVVGEGRGQPYLELSSDGRRAVGSGGCNRLTGGYTLGGNALSFGRMAATMMACPEVMDVERTFFRALGQVRQWDVRGQRLELYDGDGRLVLRFEAGPRPPQ